jgi:hypothetical protein
VYVTDVAVGDRAYAYLNAEPASARIASRRFRGLAHPRTVTDLQSKFGEAPLSCKGFENARPLVGNPYGFPKGPGVALGKIKII